MNIQSGMYGVKQKKRNFQILKNLGLDEKAKAYSRSLSGGMEKKTYGRKSYGSQSAIINSR